MRVVAPSAQVLEKMSSALLQSLLLVSSFPSRALSSVSSLICLHEWGATVMLCKEICSRCCSSAEAHLTFALRFRTLKKTGILRDFEKKTNKQNKMK